jgi:hypothetical protein
MAAFLSRLRDFTVNIASSFRISQAHEISAAKRRFFDGPIRAILGSKHIHPALERTVK